MDEGMSARFLMLAGQFDCNTKRFYNSTAAIAGAAQGRDLQEWTGSILNRQVSKVST